MFVRWKMIYCGVVLVVLWGIEEGRIKVFVYGVGKVNYVGFG